MSEIITSKKNFSPNPGRRDIEQKEKLIAIINQQKQKLKELQAQIAQRQAQETQQAEE